MEKISVEFTQASDGSDDSALMYEVYMSFFVLLEYSFSSLPILESNKTCSIEHQPVKITIRKGKNVFYVCSCL